jgi:hypothetical protein
MAYNINDVYNQMIFIVRKERGVFVTIPEAMQTLDNAQLEAVEEWFSTYGTTQIIHDAIRKLRVQKSFTSDSTGLVTFDADYLHLIGGAYTVSGSTINNVRFLNEDELALALKSQLRAVSTSNPIAIDASVGFRLYPAATQAGIYNYLRRPATPVLGYTQASGSRTITYDPLTSTQLEFTDVYINNIISRALKFWGINMAEQDIQQFAQIQTQETK